MPHKVSAETVSFAQVQAVREEHDGRIAFNLLYTPMLHLSERLHEAGVQHNQSKGKRLVDVMRLVHAP